MSHFIAGDPAPTNPAADARSYLLLAIAAGASVYAEGAESLLAEYDALKRREVLAEAIEAARAERLTDDTGSSEDAAYNRAVTDVLDSLLALAVRGAR